MKSNHDYSNVKVQGDQAGSIAQQLCFPWAAFGQELPVSQIHRLEIADCDDIVFGPNEDVFLA